MPKINFEGSNNEPEDQEDFDEQDELDEGPVRPPPGLMRTLNEDVSAPLDASVPLFPDANKRTTKVLAILKIWKVDPPGDGYKGEAPAHADETYIAKRWGNGMFRVDAVNGSGKVVRSRDLVVAVDERTLRGDDGSPHGVGLAETAIATQHEAHKREVQQILAQAEKVTDQVTKQGQQFVDLLGATYQQGAARDKEFYRAQHTQMESFFSSVMSQQQQASQQTMLLMQENFRQTIMMQAQLAQQSAQQNNPALLLGLFKEGIALGTGMDSDQDEEPWVKAIQAGVGGLASLVELKKSEIPMRAPPRMNPGVPPAAGLPAKGTPGERPPSVADKLNLSKGERMAVAEFLVLCDKKGIDIEKLIGQAKAQIADLPDAPDESDENEDENEDQGVESKSSNGARADVDGEEHSDERSATQSVVGAS